MITQEILLPSVEESERARTKGTMIGIGAFREVYRLGDSPFYSNP